MSNTVQHKRGATSDVNGYTGAIGEFVYNISTGRIHAMNGTTLGGTPHATLDDINSKAEISTTITAGTGLTGGGSLAANRTIALSSTSIASLEKADSSVQTVNGISPTGGNVVIPTGDGTVKSVAISVPTGLSVSGSPITTSGTIAVSYQSGYKGYTVAEATKLAGIAAGAQVNSVTSVAGKTGAVVLAKADVGLGNVDNTSDAAKPISTATQTALNAKWGNDTSTIDYGVL